MRIIADQRKHRIKFSQILVGLSLAKRLEGIKIDVLEIAFCALREPMTHLGDRRAFPNNVVNRFCGDRAGEAFLYGFLNRPAFFFWRKGIEPCALRVSWRSPRIDVDADGFDRAHRHQYREIRSDSPEDLQPSNP